MNYIEKFAACPVCFSKLKVSASKIICSKCGRKYSFLTKGILSLMTGTTGDTELSLKKWEDIYSDESYLEHIEEIYNKTYLEETGDQLAQFMPKKIKGKVFLELGCGSGFLGEYLAKRGWFFIGVDFSEASLIYLKKRLEKNKIKNFLLIHGDVQHLPLLKNIIDFTYGGGVIEHFKNTQSVIDHLYRVTKPKGVAFNTVPYFNLGNLIYRARWGSIPNIPILKQMSELIHIKILGGKHMVFGYELQFTRNQLRRMHERSGFKKENILVNKFDTTIQLHIIRNEFLKKLLIRLLGNSKFFYPAIKVVAKK